MLRNIRRQSTVPHRTSNARYRPRGSLPFTSDNSLCKHTDGRIVTGSDGSLADSTTSIERNFVFGGPTRHVSESYMIKSTFGNVPDSITLEELEYKQRARSIPNFLAGGNYGYACNVYEVAADIFERLAERKIDASVQYPPIKHGSLPPVFSSQTMKRQAYELAYETLKYQELLEEILSESGFFFEHPANDDMSALIMVMLFDFQNRKWALRCHIIGEIPVKQVTDVENNLFEHRVRLAAALARCRVKHQSQSIDYVLPENVRRQEKCASSLPQYAWVNTAKSETDSVIASLEENLYEEFTDNAVLIPQKGKFFRKDLHCDDVLMFPGDQKEPLKCLQVVEDGDLVLQDKTSSLAARSVGALLTEDDECDLIHTEIGSGLTTAHLAMILCNITKKRMEAKEIMFGRSPNLQTSSVGLAGPSHATTQLGEGDDLEPQPTVFAFGLRDEDHVDRMAQFMLRMGLLNVKLMREKFEDIDAKKDNRFDRVKIILLTPQCTRTAVANPIEFMLNEGDTENYDMLKDLSHGEWHKKAIEAGLAHAETLKAALRFPHIQAVVYATRSAHGHENEQVVNDAIKWHRELGESVRPFKVCPPTLPLLSNDIGKPHKFKRRSLAQSHMNHNFLRMRPTAQMNGCFIAVLMREVDTTDPAMVKDVLRRAALQGLITPIDQKPDDKPVVVTPPMSPEEHIEPVKPAIKHKVTLTKRPKQPTAPKPTFVPKHAIVLKPAEVLDMQNLYETIETKVFRERTVGKTTTLTLDGPSVFAGTLPPGHGPSENDQNRFHTQELLHAKRKQSQDKRASVDDEKRTSVEQGKRPSISQARRPSQERPS